MLAGDPSKPGFDTIILFVPANTTIPAHSHRDDRMATVVMGTWQFGYGDRFDENALKRLPPGRCTRKQAAGITLLAQVPSRYSCRSRESDRQTLVTSIRRMRRRRPIGSAAYRYSENVSGRVLTHAEQHAVNEQLDCDRTVIHQTQNLEEHRGLQTHTAW